MTLSNEQLQVVQAAEPQIAVVGPPGTGKTRVLTERIKYLLSNGVKPENIVAITFTNFAANEMKSRLSNCEKMFIGTMHSYAIQILAQNHIPIDVKTIATDADFDKLIKMACNSDIVKPQVEYLFVDEVQDLCDYEFDFISQIRAINRFYGGDADQCIYQFKGAKPQLFLNYCKNLNTTTYFLTYNYRSGQNIIDNAEYFVADIPGRFNIRVRGNMTNRGWVSRKSFDDALYDLYNNKDYGNWFVLTRTNAELENAGKMLTQYGIPYLSFKQGDFTNEEIKQFLQTDAVKLLTIHASKGLEADNVIVIGAKGWTQEEKCIEYVAATRARDKLFWCPSIVAKSRKKVATNKRIIKWE